MKLPHSFKGYKGSGGGRVNLSPTYAKRTIVLPIKSYRGVRYIGNNRVEQYIVWNGRKCVIN